MMLTYISSKAVKLLLLACCIFFVGESSIRAQTVEQQLSDLKNLVAEQQKRISKLEVFPAPIGTITAFAGPVDKIPTGWLYCDGAQMDKNQAPMLFDKIGTSWGGDGNPFFKLPDLRGMFLRGMDDGTGRDTGRLARTPPNPNAPVNAQGNRGNAVGSLQTDQMQNHIHLDGGHNHPITLCCQNGPYPARVPNHEPEEVEHGKGAIVEGNEGNNGIITFTIENSKANIGEAVSSTNGGTVKTGAETYPKNAYVIWIIRAF